MSGGDGMPVIERWFTRLLIFAGRRSPAARRWIANRAWNDYHRKHGEWPDA